MKKSLIRRVLNRMLHLLARFSPGAESVRPFLHRLRGVKITGHVFIGEEIYMENEYPHAIEIEDGAQIVLRSVLIAHLRSVGHIKICKNVWVGAGCTIAASDGQPLIIGEGAVLAAGSVVTKSVPPFTMVGGVPARPIARVTVPLTLKTGYEEWKSGLIRIDRP
jgi:acetyltransferase-like isoleucine patch superfamily enzyme